jgi:hypothetical protein
MTDYGDVLTPVFAIFPPFQAGYDAVVLDRGNSSCNNNHFKGDFEFFKIQSFVEYIVLFLQVS